MDKWRVATCEIPVTFRWWYDTPAILPAYDDSESGVIPSGTKLRFSEVNPKGIHVLCDLARPRNIERSQLPKRRVHRVLFFCRATPLQAEISIGDWKQKTKSL